MNVKGGPEGSKCLVHGPGISHKLEACDETEFTIKAVDAFGRPSSKGGAQFFVSMYEVGGNSLYSTGNMFSVLGNGDINTRAIFKRNH